METPATPSNPLRVIIIGASYGGLSAAVNLLDLCTGRPARFTNPSPLSHQPTTPIPLKLTILDERDGFFHTIGAPLALTNPKYTSPFWTHTSDITALQHPSVQFIHGSACTIDIDNQSVTLLASGSSSRKTLSYDYLIVASGLRRAWPVVPQALRKTDYLEEVAAHIARFNTDVVVIGGGAVGVETATEVKHTYPSLDVTLFHSRSELLSSEPLPDQFKEQVLHAVREAGVNVILNTRFELEEPDTQYVILAISRPVPSTSFLPGEVLDKEGYVRVTELLNFGGSKRQFAVGDVTDVKGIKRCSSAMQMGYCAAVNVYKDVTGGEDMAMGEVYPGMGLAVGKTGLYWNPDDGIVVGEEALKEMFDDDLGWTKCWEYMNLGTPHGV